MSEPQRPKIGDFQRPTDDPVSPVKQEPGIPPPKPAGDTVKNLESTEARLAKEAADAEAAVKPLHTYEEALKQVGLTRQEAAAIFDDYLARGYYEREYPISTRVKVRFRTRTRLDTKRYYDQLEAQQPKYMQTQSDLMYRYLLSASISQIGKETFKFPDRKATSEDVEKLFAERLAYVDNIGEALYQLLCEQLQKFDTLVSVALKEGAVENF